MSVISVNELSFSFGIKPVIRNLSFSLEEGDKVGIIGVNGCGKSTLVKLISGELEADSGNIYIAKDRTVGVLSQDGAFSVNELSGASALEQMYTAFPELLLTEKRLAELEKRLGELSHDKEPSLFESVSTEYTELNYKFIEKGGLEFRSRAAAMLMRLGYGEEAMGLHISKLSGGQRTRLALARELYREPDILILDEPTNHLDTETLFWLEGYLSSYKKCVIIISHDRYFLDRVTNKTLAIENSEGKLYSGGYTATVEQRRVDREAQLKRYQDQQKEIARQEAYIEKQRQWNRERNIIAAESRLKLLDKMEKIEKPKDEPKSIRIKFGEAIPSGSEVLRVKRLGMSFGDTRVFSGLDFLIKKDERVFVVGENGAGKSTFLSVLIGRLNASEGYRELGYNVKIGYYDQENQRLDPKNTVLEELWGTYPNMKEAEIRSVLASFRFYYEDTEKTVEVLSGGERARLTLAKLMLSPINLLVLDEPTNHLDIPSREALEEAILNFEGTVIAVSHDRYFTDRLATRIIEIIPAKKGGGMLDYRASREGEGYSEYLRFKEGRAPFAESSRNDGERVSANKEQYLKNKQEAADARREKARVERLKKEALVLEGRIEEIDRELFGEAATNYVRAAELEAEKAEAEERLLLIYEDVGV